MSPSLEQAPFTEGVRDLACRRASSWTPSRLSPASPARRDAESSATDVPRDGGWRRKKYFQEAYAGGGGAEARAYGEKRGITAPWSRGFRSGTRRRSGTGCRDFCRYRRSPPTSFSSGMEGDERGRYDFFRDRVMLAV